MYGDLLCGNLKAIDKNSRMQGQSCKFKSRMGSCQQVVHSSSIVAVARVAAAQGSCWQMAHFVAAC